MTLPSFKTVKQWLPLVCGCVATLWIGLLVLLSLFPSMQEPAQPEASLVPAQGCTSMPGGFSICDDIPELADKNI